MGLDWDSSSGNDGVHHSSSSMPSALTYTVDLEQVPTAAASRQQNSDDTTSQLAARYLAPSQPLTRTAPLPAFALWIALCRSLLTTPLRLTETNGRTRGRLGRLVRRTDGMRCLPSTRSADLARCDQRNRRLSDRLQLLPWNPGPIQGSDPCLQVSQSQGLVACGLRVGRFSALQRRDTTGELQSGFPSTAAQASSTRTPSSPTTRVRRSSSIASSSTGHGPSRAWLSQASFAGSPRQVVLLCHGRQHPFQQRVRRAEIRLYCPAPPVSATCVQSSVQWCSPL